MKNLKDRMPKKEGGESLRLADIAGENVIVTAVSFTQGEFGEIAFMEAARANGDSCTVMAGGVLVIESLHSANDAGDFPVQARFIKPKKAWLVTDWDDNAEPTQAELGL